MDRKLKKSLRLHLLYIYIGYFVALVLGFFHGFAPDFMKGLYEGMKAGIEAEQLQENGVEPRIYFMTTGLARNGGEWTPIVTRDTTVHIEADFTQAMLCVRTTEETTPEVIEQIGRSGYSLPLFALAILAKLAILILVALIINVLRKSVRDEQPLPRRIITYTRWVAVLLVLAALLGAAGSYVYSLAANAVLEGSNLPAHATFAFDYWNIFMAILVLFSAEVFSIGTQLSEEQKLTI